MEDLVQVGESTLIQVMKKLKKLHSNLLTHANKYELIKLNLKIFLRRNIMKHKMIKEIFRNNIFLTLLLIVLNSCFATAQNTEVYVSSQAGDRLTRKNDATFIADTKSSAPVITVNEKKSFQKIEGFGATFNEA